MSKLNVRVYNVQQGDAILVSVPESFGNSEVIRHILIDVGNSGSGYGSTNKVYKPVIEDIITQLKGNPVDLYIMTHEHMDHVEGLPYAKKQLRLNIKARYAWLTASAEGKAYYQRHPRAKRALKKAIALYKEITHYLKAVPEDFPRSRLMAANNDMDETDKCVSLLRKLAPKQNTHYVYRGYNTQNAHPFKEARLEILAPEEDTSVYYRYMRHVALGVVNTGGNAGGKSDLITPLPPPGVDAGSFYRLLQYRREGFVDGLLSIDAAKNNTSVVFSLKWRGWNLLFCGDAQVESWIFIYENNVLEPVHFLKVGHHGSHNGTPEKEILGKILPTTPTDSRPRFAAISAYYKAYKHPHEPTIKKLKPLCTKIFYTETSPPIKYYDVEFPDIGE